MTGRHGRLGQELRLLRDLKGVGGRELGRRIGIGQPKVSRIERGKTLPTEAEVTAWANALSAPEQTQRLLDMLADAARRDLPDDSVLNRFLTCGGAVVVLRSHRFRTVHTDLCEVDGYMWQCLGCDASSTDSHRHADGYLPGEQDQARDDANTHANTYRCMPKDDRGGA